MHESAQFKVYVNICSNFSRKALVKSFIIFFFLFPFQQYCGTVILKKMAAVMNLQFENKRIYNIHTIGIGGQEKLQVVLQRKDKKLGLNQVSLFFPLCGTHCMKSIQIRSFFWSLFSCIRTGLRICGQRHVQENL